MSTSRIAYDCSKGIIQSKSTTKSILGHRRTRSAGFERSHNFHHHHHHHHHHHNHHNPLYFYNDPPDSQLWKIAPLIQRTASDVTIRDQSSTHLSSQAQVTFGFINQPIPPPPPPPPSSSLSQQQYGSLDNELELNLVTNIEQINEEIIEKDYQCKIAWLQPLAKINYFVFCCCILVMLQQALSSGYFNSVITTIEKRFDFSSQMSGAIVSTFELGNLATIIFVSYYGMSRHVPRWIGTGVLLIAFGSIMFSIPHFISSNDHDDHNGTMESSRIDGEQYCRLNETIDNNGEKTKCSNGNDIPPQVYIFMFAMIMIGSGGTPIFTLGTTYIDDHVPECRSSTYMSFLYGMVGFGLVFGFLLGGTCIAIHENIFGNVPLGVTINSSRWIGAWWIGFILLGILLLIVAIPFFIFPKRLKCIKEKRQSGNNQIEIEQQIPSHSPKKLVRRQQSLSEIPSCLIRLITNPVYMITSLGSCMELAIASGFIIFLPKFLETQFEMTKSEANLMAGSVAIPGACFGIFLGSYLLQRFQLNTRGAIQMVLLFNIICCSIFMGVYFIGCPNISMAGINVPYPNDVNHTEFNLSSNCNNGCHCSTNQYEPMCDQRTGTTFYSPCFAGCRQSLKQDIEECLCLEANHTSILITSGTCSNQCGKYLYPFMFLLFIVTLLSSITQMPVVKATLRSVSQEDRSLALGLQFVLFRLFGYIPSPILFGQIIDQTCLIYKTNCNQMPSGFCMLYDVEEFRQRYIGICISLKIVSFIFFLIDLLYICYREKSETSIIVAGDDDDDVDEIKDDCALMANHNNDNNDIDDFEQLPIVSMNHDGRHNNCPTIIETNEDCHSIDSNGSFNMVPITSAMIKCSPNDSSF